MFSGTDAHFSCGIRGSSIGWWINDTTFDRLPDKIQSDITIEPNSNQLGFHFSTLKIVGAAKYSGTKVQCISGVDRSNIATMYVQGVSAMHTRIIEFECVVLHRDVVSSYGFDDTGVQWFLLNILDCSSVTERYRFQYVVRDIHI